MFEITEDMLDDIIPLDKLVTRLKTDLHLAKRSAENYGKSTHRKVLNKNKVKLSMLYYLEMLEELGIVK